MRPQAIPPRHRWPVCLLLAALAGGCTARPAPPITVEQRPWPGPAGAEGVQLLTQHFDLRITAQDQELLSHLAPFVETAFAGYERLVPPARTPQERLPVYLFGTRAQWATFTQHFAPAQASVYLRIQSGGFTDNATATAVLYDIHRDRTLAVLGHEGMHQYLARYFPRPVPAWLNEGLSCQWEAFDLEGDRPVFTPHRNFFRRNTLRDALATDDGLIPLSELVRMDSGDAVIQSGAGRSRSYYGQVWSLVLMLIENRGDYGAGFRRLLADVGRERFDATVSAYRATTPNSSGLNDGEIAFRHYIASDLSTFELDYRAFTRTLVY